MQKKILTSDDLKGMDPKLIFECIIYLWGMEGAIQIVQEYYFIEEKDQTNSKKEVEIDYQILNRIMDGLDAFSDLVIERLKND